MSATIATGFCEGALSARLFYRHLAAKEARAQLVVIHGFGEHSGRYEPFMRAMADRGLSTLAIDYRGHGRADGRRGHVNRFEEYLGDVDCAVTLAAKLEADVPQVLLGHSIGGLILAHRLQRPVSPRVVGGVMSSPSLGFKLQVSAWKDAVGTAAASLWPSLTLDAGVDASLLSHDPAVVEAYEKDPLVVREVTARWYHEAQEAQKLAMTGAGFISLPLLVMHAGDDQIADPVVSRTFAESVPTATYEEFPGMYHELLNETERDKVFETLSGFVDGLVR